MSLGNESEQPAQPPQWTPPAAPQSPPTQPPFPPPFPTQQNQMPSWDATPRHDYPSAPPMAPQQGAGGYWAPPPSGPRPPMPPIPPSGGYPFGYGPTPAPVPPQPAAHSSRRTFGRAAVATLVVLTAIVAILGGMVIGSGLSGKLSPTSSQANNPAVGNNGVPTAPANPGSGSSNTPFFGNGGGFGNGSSSSGSANQGTQNNGSSSSLSTAAARVQPGVVNIVTQLGYEQAMAAGTGMVIGSSGQVLTNNHVVQGATSISATVVGTGKTYTAKVIGTAPTQDVAVIQLENASGLKTVDLGDSSKVKVGDPVVAMGNAGGKGGNPSIVQGSVVALGQSITAGDESGGHSEELHNLIEVNAPIVSGDSGGPLVNTAGEVIGMDTAASTGNNFQQGESQGFAIPIATADDIAKQIIAGKASDVVHIGAPGILGVEVMNAGANSNDPFGGSQGNSSTGGALVQGVSQGLPAANAGLTQGDTITSLNGTAVSSADGLTSLMSGRKPGQKVTLTWTDQSGQSHKATITLVPGPAD
jgi:S1-C subfamily serine protease